MLTVCVHFALGVDLCMLVSLCTASYRVGVLVVLVGCYVFDGS